MNGTKLWDVKLSSKKSYSNWSISHEELEENQFDTALILNVTRPIYKDVLEYIKENQLMMQFVKLLKPLEKPLIVMNYMIVFANGETTLYLEKRYYLLEQVVLAHQ